MRMEQAPKKDLASASVDLIQSSVNEDDDDTLNISADDSLEIIVGTREAG